LIRAARAATEKLWDLEVLETIKEGETVFRK